MQRRMEAQQELYRQEENQQALDPNNFDNQQAVNHHAIQVKIKNLYNECYFNLILAVGIIISASTSGNTCNNDGWDAQNFLYTISALYWAEFILLLLQVNYVKNYYREHLFIIFLRYVNLCTLVGFYISGNVGYYNNPDETGCQKMLIQVFIVLIIGYIEMLKCCLVSLFVCILIPMVFYYARQNQQPQWIPTAPQFVQNLYKQKFNEFAQQHNGEIGNTDQDKQCAICFLEYTENDEITPLPCDDRHFFHSGCIQEWLKANNSCPMCRQPITQAAIEEQRKKILYLQTAESN